METTAHDPSTPEPTSPTTAETLLLTLDEAARELRCARRSVERHVSRRLITVVHLGRSVRIERAELERFIARMREPKIAVADD